MSYPEKLTSGYYRVKMAWEDKKAIGQFRILKKAKEAADKNPGSFVFGPEGAVVYPVKDAVESGGALMENEGTAMEDEATPMEDEAAVEESVDTSEAADTADDKDTVAGTAPVAYCKLKTLMNIRSGPSLDAEKVAVYKKGTIHQVLEVREDGWLKICCPDSLTEAAYVANQNGAYAYIGRAVYTVKPDDNAAKISLALFGERGRFHVVQELNGMECNAVYAGMKLLVP